MRRKHRRKNQKKIIVFFTIALICMFSVGYAAFSSEFLISGKGTIVKKEISVTTEDLKFLEVTSGDGLYADIYEEGRYIYKGADPANYITFNGEEAGWRILAIEADGTLKIIRNSILSEKKAFDSQGARDGTSNVSGIGGTYCAISSGYGCNVWSSITNLVGKPSSFINGSEKGTVLLDSSLNLYLNGTYLNSVDTTNVVIHSFGVGPVTLSNTDLAVQITSEQSYKWDGKVGLMSVSDYLKSNTNSEQCTTLKLNNENYDTCKNTNYLFTSLAANFEYTWTINPRASSVTNEFAIDGKGEVINTNARNINGVAPVFYLKSDIKLSGSGTDIDPYTIIE